MQMKNGQYRITPIIQSPIIQSQQSLLVSHFEFMLFLHEQVHYVHS